MTNRRLTADGAVSGPATLELQSKLLASLIDEPEPDRRLRVFDAGPADSSTVNFFSRYRCHLYFADLYAEPVLIDQREEFDEGVLTRRFRELLDFPAETAFDICLFWDFFNYLSQPALRAFSAAFADFIAPGAKAYCLGAMKRAKIHPNLRYGIQGLDLIRMTELPERRLPNNPHPQSEFKSMLSGLSVRKSILMPDGRLEMLLEAKPD